MATVRASEVRGAAVGRIENRRARATERVHFRLCTMSRVQDLEHRNPSHVIVLLALGVGTSHLPLGSPPVCFRLQSPFLRLARFLPMVCYRRRTSGSGWDRDAVYRLLTWKESRHSTVGETAPERRISSIHVKWATNTILARCQRTPSRNY
ncbi:hypothetical protein BDW59DRAFT_482 [Aspergillus cavernicola]|uniref:Uncharacterized protein n=1 Tax=Aspergillus cavernicola TaxID=176166 RepID=A0ABR4J4Z1_9EURO